MQEEMLRNYHADAVRSFQSYKKLAERAIEQISDEEFFEAIDDEANSMAVIVKHIAGNAISRWRDFLTTDGEKADRNRDAEFEVTDESRAGLMDHWETGWKTLFENVEPLTRVDFEKSVTIRGEPHSVIEAINRQLTHYAYHIGQIVLLAKHFRSQDWKTLSVPKNRSADFNNFLTERQALGIEKGDRMEAPSEFLRSEEKE